MSVSVYIAAPYPEKAWALRVANGLAAQGITITSRWLSQVDPPDTDEFARQDLADILRCDVLVALNPDGWAEVGTGGRHVELGYALACGIPALLVGERTNVFHHLSHIKAVDDTEDLAKHIAKLAARPKRRVVLAANDALLACEKFVEWYKRDRQTLGPTLHSIDDLYGMCVHAVATAGAQS